MAAQAKSDQIVALKMTSRKNREVIKQLNISREKNCDTRKKSFKTSKQYQQIQFQEEIVQFVPGHSLKPSR